MSTENNKSVNSDSSLTYAFINDFLTQSADAINTGYAEFRKIYYSEIANNNLSESI